MAERGFTLIELVVVIILLGILAAFAIPKFFNLDVYRDRAAYDEVAGAIRYAQKLAVASGCPVQVVLTANGYFLQQRDLPLDAAGVCGNGVAFTTIVNHPVTTEAFAGLVITPPAVPFTFTFDALGSCTDCANDVDIDVAGQTITVVAETGYVNAP
jgi:MSHA pilin protein MshC